METELDQELKCYFTFQSRIDMYVPVFGEEWSELDVKTKLKLASEWAKIKGTIPERIKEREEVILSLLDQMYKDVDFDTFCELNRQMIELAAEVNELNIWLRFQPNVNEEGVGAGSAERMHF